MFIQSASQYSLANPITEPPISNQNIAVMGRGFELVAGQFEFLCKVFLNSDKNDQIIQ